MLVILTPQAMTDPTQIAEQLKPLAKQEGKPLIASWMGGVDVAAGEEILNRANIPRSRTPIPPPAPSITCGNIATT
jgi:acetyltransferase